MIIPSRIDTPLARLKKSLKYSSVAPAIRMPKMAVPSAAQRNHHSAREASLAIASLRAAGVNSAKAGTWTKLK